MSAQRFRLPALLCGALIVSATSAEIPDEYLRSPLAELYGLAPTIERPRISPDGTKMLYLQQDQLGIAVLQVIDFTTGEIVSALKGTFEEYDIGWCEWASESRILCDFIYAVNADGTDTTKIPPGRIREPPERHASLCNLNSETRAGQLLLDWLPESPEYVQRTCGSALRLNLYTGQTQSQRATTNIPGEVMSDGHGFGRLQRYRDLQAGIDRWSFRRAEGAEWIRLYESNPLLFEDPFRPIGFGATVNDLFHLSWDQDRWTLFRTSLAGDPVSMPIFSHPLLDVELVDMMGVFDRVVAVAYLDGRPQRYVVDEPVAAAYQAAIEIFPEQNLEIVDESWDGNTYLLLVREDRRAGSYYLLNKLEGSILPIGPEYAQLDGVDLAETRTVSFAGADGGTIAGHLTLPPGREGPVPAVIMPRGIPARLDVADPNYLVQFLAASGYAVLRVNYRGASQYGGWLAERAALGWQQAADDVGAAAAYLVGEGIATTDRICAVGRDLGAYAALMNGVVDPGRLACIVGIGAVADARALAGSVLGTIVTDRDDVIREGSPTRRAAEMSAPVLLFHGHFDGAVSMFGHTLELNRALERANKDVQFIEYRYGRHEIDRNVYRIDMLTRIAAFLEEQIGAI